MEGIKINMTENTKNTEYQKYEEIRIQTDF